MSIYSFSGKYHFLSNFWIEKDGLSVEHRYQAAKTLNPTEKAQIMTARTPGDAKRLGRKCTIRPGWDFMKVSEMLRLLRQKFQDPDLKALLLATEDEHLEEGNHWGDRFWGTVNGVGSNRLGQLLMQVREELRSNQ
jgi:ribA/ribD-fused uncharacterized protein